MKKQVKPQGFSESFEEYAQRCAAKCTCGRAERYNGNGVKLPDITVPHLGHNARCQLWAAYREWKKHSQRLWESIKSRDLRRAVL